MQTNAENCLARYEPDHVQPPGALIQEYLDEHGLSGRELARRCGRSAKLISEVISGKASLEPETALQIERVLNVPASVCLKMEAEYRLHLALREEEQELAQQASWAASFPLRELHQRGYIALPEKPASRLRELLRFFGCGSVAACEEQFNEMLAVSYRHSPAFKSDRQALLAWLRIGELKAEKIDPADFDRQRFMEALKYLRTLTTRPMEDFIPEITARCADAGVAYVVEPTLPKISLSGISRWLTPKRALIQQTLRHRSNDHFWFTFFHECAHLLLHSRKAVFVDGDGENSAEPEQEAEANDWAADFLVPQLAVTRFITRFEYREDYLAEFAQTHGVAPAIVVGQLQHRKVLRHNQLNNLKEYYDPAAVAAVAEAAIVNPRRELA